MNKDVIYIESEDDITDILSKIAASEEKVVALVPPKKANVLRSAVNIKLIAKAAKAADKVAVLVTADATLLRLCAAARVPVAKTLQSRPEIPEPEEALEKAAEEQVIDEDLTDPDAPEPTEKSAKNPDKNKTAPAKSTESSKKSKKPAEAGPDEEDEDKKDSDQDKKSKKDKSDKSKKVPDIKKYRKFIIIGVVAVVAIVGFLVWALVFAPAVTIAVTVKTTSNNFSESVTLTTGESNPSEGLLLISEKKVEDTAQTQFTATGTKDLGSKASGTLSVAHIFKAGEDDFVISSGTTFIQNGLSYVSTGAVTIQAPGKCNNDGENCQVTTNISISAIENGDKYNIGTTDSGWTSTRTGLTSIKNTSAISGGSTNVVTVVQQSDIDAASANLATDSESSAKDVLKDEVGDDNIAIDSTYATSSANLVSSPAVGEEVKDGVTPTLTSTTTYTVYVVDKAETEKFIDSKVTLADDQKIYSYGSPYFERFTGGSDGKFTARLKTSSRTGPEITPDQVLEKAKGRKTGEVQSLLKSINGVSSVNIKTSYFWVTSVPDDSNKVTVEVTNEDES